MVIINKGSTIVEGNVQELLNEGLLKVNFTVDKPKKALECLNTSRFHSSNIVITDTAITIETEQSFISDINSLLVANDIKVEGIQSTRSLEEYFLSITKP
jgi:ABC-type multidrug transport system ATPase subunit